MNCSAFRERHAAYLDDDLDDIALVAMQSHVGECAHCARHDTAVRRALLIVRNMPTIEPSAHFSARLHERLRAARAADARRQPLIYTLFPGLGGLAAATAGVVAAGYIAVAVFGQRPGPFVAELAMAPVVALASEPEPSPPSFVGSSLGSPAIVASISAGLPVWPGAIFAAGQAPAHFVATRLTGPASPAR